MTKYRIVKFKNDYGQERYNVEFKRFYNFLTWWYDSGYFHTLEDAMNYIKDKDKSPNVVWEGTKDDL